MPNPLRGPGARDAVRLSGGRDGPLGILKLSGCAPGTFGEHELAVVQRFTSLASVALKRAQTLEDLQARMLKIERQNALAHLARGVAHDINNALGEVIPLVQQIQADVQSGTIVPTSWPRISIGSSSRSRSLAESSAG
jgi:GAF domain-containing protein